MGAFSHPAAQRVLDELRGAFTGTVFDTRKKFFLFVCGGSVKEGSETLRRKFLNWSQLELPDFITILAEETFKLSPDVDLTKFEALVANVADVVLIFPESPGSYSEAGLFSVSDKIPAKTILANDSNERDERSFLNLGPFRRIGYKSTFGAVVDIDLSNPEADFTRIKSRLNKWAINQTRKRFLYAPYSTLSNRQRLSVTLEMLHLLRLATLQDLRYAIKFTFQKAAESNVQRILSILQGAGYVSEVDGLLGLTKGRQTMLEFAPAIRKEQLIAGIMQYYQKNCPELFDVITAWTSA